MGIIENQDYPLSCGKTSKYNTASSLNISFLVPV